MFFLFCDKVDSITLGSADIVSLKTGVLKHLLQSKGTQLNKQLCAMPVFVCSHIASVLHSACVRLSQGFVDERDCLDIGSILC